MTVRDNGNEAHEGIPMYLQSKYGPLDRIPGQIAVGPVKAYACTDFIRKYRYDLKPGSIAASYFSEIVRCRELADETSAIAFALPPGRTKVFIDNRRTLSHHVAP